jgi:hypothetical protein
MRLFGLSNEKTVRILLAAFGHTVVRTGEKWIPSGMYQRVEWPDGPEGKIERTHIDDPHLDSNAPDAYLGGGQVVVKALHRLIEGHPSADVAIIGGTPLSMQKRFGSEAPSEAWVMSDYLNSIAGRDYGAIVVGETRTTEEDTRALLDLMYAAAYDRAMVVCMGFRLPRARLLLRHVAHRSNHTDFLHRIVLVDAEQFLPERFSTFVEMNQSAAYRLTMSQEQFGVAKLLANP